LSTKSTIAPGNDIRQQVIGIDPLNEILDPFACQGNDQTHGRRPLRSNSTCSTNRLPRTSENDINATIGIGTASYIWNTPGIPTNRLPSGFAINPADTTTTKTPGCFPRWTNRSATTADGIRRRGGVIDVV